MSDLLVRWVQIGIPLGVSLPLWLLWVKIGQCFVELVRIRHELEDINKSTKPKVLKFGMSFPEAKP